MALEHAILVSLLERPGSGYELARRFERSIGRFWTATHQQIYRVLRRMEDNGWLVAEAVDQDGRPTSGPTPWPRPAVLCSPRGCGTRRSPRRSGTSRP